MDGLRNLTGTERERRLVELRHLPTLRNRQLAALRRGARILGVLLRELREVLLVRRDELGVELGGERLRLDEDVTDVTRLRLLVDRLVLVVVRLDRRVGHVHVARHLLVHVLRQQLELLECLVLVDR